MNMMIEWLGTYSPPVVALLALGTVFIFVLRQVFEKALKAELDKRNQRLEILLQRRSKFEDRVLTEQYVLVTELKSKLGDIGADINRLRKGMAVEGLMQGTELVPLTEIYIDLQAKRFLLKQTFHTLLRKEADTLLALANTSQAEKISSLGKQILQLNEGFRAEMNAAFGIDKIRWDRLDLKPA